MFDLNLLGKTGGGDATKRFRKGNRKSDRFAPSFMSDFIALVRVMKYKKTCHSRLRGNPENLCNPDNNRYTAYSEIIRSNLYSTCHSYEVQKNLSFPPSRESRKPL